jgi:hypothetical protein
MILSSGTVRSLDQAQFGFLPFRAFTAAHSGISQQNW